MKYSDLLRTLVSMSPEDLDRPVLVTLGNDQDEIAPVEGTQLLSQEAADSLDMDPGTLLLRLT